MKLLEKFVQSVVEDALNKSKLLLDAIDSIQKTSSKISNVSKNLKEFEKNIELHRKAINDLYLRQDALIKIVKSDTMSTEMPKITKEKPAKSN